MWKCPECGEEHEDQFHSCWKCANRPKKPIEDKRSNHGQIELEDVLRDKHFWKNMDLPWFDKKRKKAKILAYAQRMLMNEAIFLRARLEGVQAEEIEHFQHSIDGGLYREYIDNATFAGVAAEIYNRAMAVAYLRADVLLLRKKFNRQNELLIERQAPDSRQATSLRTRFELFNGYFKNKSVEAENAWKKGSLDQGHIRALVEAAIVGIPEAANLLAEITEANKDRDPETARIESYFWLKRTYEVTKDEDKKNELKNRISEIELQLSPEDFAKLEKSRNALSQMLSGSFHSIVNTDKNGVS